QALAVGGLLIGELLAERPVLVEQGHADRAIGIHHLLGVDHFDLVGIDIEPKLGCCDFLAGIDNPLQRREIPLRALKQQPFTRHGATFSCFARRWNRSWNTGKISLRSQTLRIDSGAPARRRRSYSVHSEESGISKVRPASW